MPAIKTTYFQTQRFFLLYGGNSLEKEKGLVYKIYSIIVMFFCSIYPVFTVADLLTQNFNDAVNGWFYTFCATMDSTLAIFGYINRRNLGKVLQKLEKPPFVASKERGNEEEEIEALNGWFAFFKKQAFLLICGASLIISYRIVYSLIKRYMYEEWILPWSSIKTINSTYSPNYELLWIFQNTVFVYYCFTTMQLMLISTGCLSLITVQLKMLQRYLERILKLSRKEEFEDQLNLMSSSTTYWRHLNTHIKQAVNYHLEITNVTAEIDGIFNGAYLCVLIVTLLLICVDVYQASLLPHFNLKFIFLLMEILTVFSPSLAYCYYGEQITYENQRIGEIAYEIDFVETDVRFQKSLMMIIRQSQKPLKIKAGNMIEGSMTVVLWILKTSFSAYMMLRTLNAPQ